MTKTFNNAPLIELIAELKWDQNASQAQTLPMVGANLQFFQNLNVAPSADFFTQFSAGAYANQFSRMERVVPENFPVFVGQPVYRFRPNDVNNNNLLYQIGVGLFSAHAMPPYKSWLQFRPTIMTGVEVLLATRLEADRDKPFTSLSVRYIDSFGPDLTGGRDMEKFIEDVLGFKVVLPPGVAGLVADGQKASSTMQVQIPMKNGLVMNVNVGQALVNNNLAILMDVSVLSIAPVAPNIEAVMASFEQAHLIIHNMFISVTGKIADLMKPQEHPI